MVKINLESISKGENRIIGMRFLPLVEDFYKNPENEKAFQKWLKTKNTLKI